MAQTYFDLEYLLKGNGWARATLRAPSGSACIRVSYLHDSLGELVQVAGDLLEGKSFGVVTFDGEPDDHVIVFSREGALLEYELRFYPRGGTWGGWPEDEFVLVLRGCCSPEALADCVLQILKKLLVEHGLHGYDDLWGEAPFPEEGLARLAGLRARQGTG